MAEAVDLVEIEMHVGGLLLSFEQQPNIDQRLREGFEGIQGRAVHNHIGIRGRRVIAYAEDVRLNPVVSQLIVEGLLRVKFLRVNVTLEGVTVLVAGEGE